MVKPNHVRVWILCVGPACPSDGNWTHNHQRRLGIALLSSSVTSASTSTSPGPPRRGVHWRKKCGNGPEEPAGAAGAPIVPESDLSLTCRRRVTRVDGEPRGAQYGPVDGGPAREGSPSPRPKDHTTAHDDSGELVKPKGERLVEGLVGICLVTRAAVAPDSRKSGGISRYRFAERWVAGYRGSTCRPGSGSSGTNLDLGRRATVFQNLEENGEW